MNQETASEINDRSSSGIVSFDDVLGGGYVRDRLFLIDGDPGAGKTTLALQYLMEGARRGEKVLYITLSETREELAAVAASHNWSLEGVEILELFASERSLSAESQLTMFHPSEVELSETTQVLLNAIEKDNPRRVVLDSLAELRLLSQNSLRYRRQILALKSFFVGRQCTVLLLDDRTSERSDMQLQSIAHGVISLEQLAPGYGSERRRLRVIKMRSATYRGGYHDFIIKRGGIEVFPRLIAAEHISEMPQGQISSGVRELDDLLGGGIDRGTSTLFVGPAGSGKSTLAIHYAIAAAQRGEHAAIFMFDEGIATLRRRVSALGMDFTSGEKPGQIKLTQLDPGQVSPGEFAHLVRQAVEQRKASVVVIDSLNGYMNAMPDERFLTIQLHELLSYLSYRSVTTMMVVAQHGLLTSTMEPAIDASYLADSVVLLRYFEDAGHVKKAISVFKKRSGRHEDTIRELSFSSDGLEISEPLEQFQGVLAGVPVLKNQAPFLLAMKNGS